MGIVGVRTGVKAFSDKPQENVNKTSGFHSLSAQDMAKMGDQNVGDVLNKIADPNWVDPSKKMRTAGSDKMDKDAFMKLMLAQMKNQDPTNPMQSHEMAAQLAQFTSVEQMQNMNKNLEEMKMAQRPTESFQALNYIGKAVAGDSSKIMRQKGDVGHDVSFQLLSNADEVEIKIKNQNGEVIRKEVLGSLKKGDNQWSWNGQDERGHVVPSGEYTVVMDAKNQGAKVGLKTDFSGVISGINYTNEGPVLMVGTQTIKMRDVKKIIDPSLMQNDQKTQTSPKPDLQIQQAAANLNESAAVNLNSDAVKGAPDAALEPKSNLMEDIAMSNDMMAKVQKETSLKE
jgi:flagellar basal-body rod modification protein FlgD